MSPFCAEPPIILLLRTKTNPLLPRELFVRARGERKRERDKKKIKQNLDFFAREKMRAKKILVD